jgi:O-methyltransferase involved in polyketide biosynthesis
MPGDSAAGHRRPAIVRDGFDAAAPAIWLAEGLLPYLPAADCDRLLDTAAGMSAPGSRFASEYFVRPPVEADAVDDSSSAGDKQRWRSVLDMLSTGPVAASPAAWLSARGWVVGQVSTVSGEGQARGRPAPETFARPGGMEVWLFDGIY